VDIHQATADYEHWLGQQTPLVASALREKHAVMRDDAFAFFRGTFYRWAQRFPELLPDLIDAPRVIAVGDLHVDSFGTWRDAEGRLAWGVDDFDDAFPLPYTNDLVRLAASAKISRKVGVVAIRLHDACDAIMAGYRSALQNHGAPFVLAEAHDHLETLGIREIEPPTHFWDGLRRLPTVRHGVPRGAMRALRATLSDAIADFKVVRRRAGTGSLGQPRFVLIADCAGADIAREAKALVASSCVWATGGRQRRQPYYEQAIRHAIRSRDPYQCVVGKWIVRRLSPDSNPIRMADLSESRDELRLLQAMGAETANVHLGSLTNPRAIVRDLEHRGPGWLRHAAKVMAQSVETDWNDYRHDARSRS
jgi:uncharacterized protein (DUF2252 family)